MPVATCTDIDAIDNVKQPERRQCAECLKTGSRWLHLRTCQQCGLTHCCDDSPNKHATAHARATSHPVIASAEPRERWLYCYTHEAFAEY